MPDARTPKSEHRATLVALDFDKNGDPTPKPKEHRADVQFNPETLTVNYRNQQTGGDLPESSGVQHVGRGSTTMSVDLLYDLTRPTDRGSQLDDVRKQTTDVNWFMRELQEASENGDNEKYVPSGVRFVWGTFQFDGVMTVMDETLEFFDPEGRPLRASVSIRITKPGIYFKRNPDGANLSAGLQAGASVGVAGGGTTPEEPPEGAENASPTSVQQVAAQRGQQDNWKEIAAQSGVENPRAIHNPDALRP